MVAWSRNSSGMPSWLCSGCRSCHEDDALRAVRAAAEMRDVLPELKLEARLGVNTGEVMTVRGEWLMTGDAVNVAARLQQSASPGTILIGEATYRLVADAVAATRVDPLSVKGKSTPVNAFRLDSVNPEAPALASSDDGRFVNRESELADMLALYGDVVGGGGIRQVTVVGDPGIGKSRLAREFVRRLDPAPLVLVGRCPPYGEGVTFWPLRELLRQAGHDQSALKGPSAETFATVRRLLAKLAADRRWWSPSTTSTGRNRRFSTSSTRSPSVSSTRPSCCSA